MKTLTTMLVLTAITIAAASAQPGPGQGPGKGYHKNRQPLMEQLDLTAEQRAALDQEQRAFQKQMVDLRADVKNARGEVRAVMDAAATATREAALQAVEKESAAELTLRKAAVEHHLRVREIIGPENAARLAALRAERREDRQERRGDGYGRGPDRGPGFDDGERGPPVE